MEGKQFTDLTKASVLKDSDIIAVHDGNGLKKSSMGDVTTYMSDKFSNPNLLINPDFKINQRGATRYESDTGTTTKNVYSVDRWSLYGHKLAVNSDKSITLTPTSYSNGTFSQILEDAVEGDVTIQVYVAGISGSATVLVTQSDGKATSTIGNLKNGLNIFHFNKGIKKLYIRVLSGTLTLKYAKLEQGSIATPFVVPNPAEELTKCERFLLIMPSSMVGYRYSAFIYVSVEKLKNMRINGSCLIIGKNNDTSLLINTEGQGGVSIGAGTNVDKDKKFIRIEATNISETIKNKVLAVDMNDTIIIIDAEIY